MQKNDLHLFIEIALEIISLQSWDFCCTELKLEYSVWCKKFLFSGFIALPYLEIKKI